MSDHQTTVKLVGGNNLVTSINVSASLTIKIRDTFSKIEYATSVLHPNDVDLDSLLALETYMEHMLRIEGVPGFVSNHSHAERLRACSIILDNLKMTKQAIDY